MLPWRSDWSTGGMSEGPAKVPLETRDSEPGSCSPWLLPWTVPSRLDRSVRERLRRSQQLAEPPPPPPPGWRSLARAWQYAQSLLSQPEGAGGPSGLQPLSASCRRG